jgi:nicotinate-nucleotide adenylyltransferase
MLNSKTIKYINEHNLYHLERMQQFLDSERYGHCLRTASFAQELAAKHYPKIATKAFVAGLYHDFAKQ